MAMNLADLAQNLDDESDLRCLIEALGTDHQLNSEEQKKLLATYDQLGVTYNAFKGTIKQTEDAKEECLTRSSTQAEYHAKFMTDLDIAWSAYHALVNAVKDIETEIEEWHHINPETCALDKASRGTQDLLALLKEREIAERARENSDRLCADMIELAE